ncbi:GLUG motif-containing protein [Comamonas antarctica]|uniref:two-partner secretion domain-containing protein n=1 Tax=Comamonas antarctica TaxID=2743470 RepID=UPI0028E92A95|nr:GLUG motif-containing protein [Comamonas antarctica]
MNHFYRVLWNRALGRFCVTSEVGRNRSRNAARSSADHPDGCLLAQWVVGLALACSLPAWSSAGLPQGLDTMTGVAWVNTDPVRMTIRQELPKAILDWQSFNIGAGQQVIFEQPNAAAVALNRVIGTDASAIQGTLQANGRVFLVNPNGVLFGAGANVSVGGLVASTLKLSDQDFLAGRYQFSGPGSSVPGASVVNQGWISASDGGAVVLLGGSVSNQGTIAARLGSVALAAGNQVLLDFAGDGLLDVQVQQSAVNALVENRQLIQADGGSVLMTAKATDALLQTVVNNTGAVQARTIDNRSGKIVLLGGFDGGTTRVSGTLDASAPDGGDGGFVDTSGANVQIEGGTRVTTLAAQGKTGSWLIDATNFTISAGAGAKTDSGIGADTLMSSLATTGMTLQTLATGSEAGDIHVNAPVSWNKNVLTLNAHRNININALMSVNGEGKLALNYGGTQGNATATPVAGSNLNVYAGGRVDFEKSGYGLLAVNGEDFKVIHTLDDLSGINQGLAGKYALGRDINASATADTAQGFMPIGTANTLFTGVFDGLGHVINKLNINRSAMNNVGLFGFARDAVLRNIGLVESSINGKSRTGALVGYQIRGSISNAYATGTVTGTTYTGGLVGQNEGSINNAYATVSVTGTDDVGGLVGYQRYGTITNAYATGSVMNSHFGGGLVGYLEGGIVINAYATGAVMGYMAAGGLVGAQMGGSINNAYATGAVSGSTDIGGLVGNLAIGMVNNSFATGRVTGSFATGGLIGFTDRSEINNSYWNTETTGEQTSAGGLGKTSEQMKQLATYANWDISNQGGSNAV